MLAKHVPPPFHLAAQALDHFGQGRQVRVGGLPLLLAGGLAGEQWPFRGRAATRPARSPGESMAGSLSRRTCANCISVRQLHRLFAHDGTSFGAWVREQRLRRRDDLASQQLIHRAIAEIATGWAFAAPRISPAPSVRTRHPTPNSAASPAPPVTGRRSRRRPVTRPTEPDDLRVPADADGSEIRRADSALYG